MASSKTPFVFPPMAGEAPKPKYPAPESTLSHLRVDLVYATNCLLKCLNNESKLSEEKLDTQISNIDDCVFEAQNVCERVQQSSTPDAFGKEMDDMVDSILQDVDRLKVKIYRLRGFGDGTLPGQMEEMKKRMKNCVEEFVSV